MEVQGVLLTTPPDHSIYLGPQDERYSSLLSGSVEILLASSCIDSSGYPKLSVRLTRTVAFAQQCVATASQPQRRSDFLKNLRRPWTTQPQLTPDCGQSASSSTETITRCDLWRTQCLVEHHDQRTTKLRFDFGIPVPFDIPPTTETVLGTVSYAITATSTSPTGTRATATRPIQIVRRAIPGHTRTIQHMRTFCEPRLRIFLDLTPKECPGSGNKASYIARLCATPTITQGARPTQMRHVVIKELKWRVEETTTVVSNPSSNHQIQVYHKEQCVRQLSRGRMTGRWSATGGYTRTDATDDMVQISFDINIPTRTAAAPILETSTRDTSQPCLHPHPCQCSSHAHSDDAHAMLTTHQQLKLDTIAGEDVIDQETGKLVDRKPLWKLFGAFFPLSVYDFLSSHEMPHTAFSANDLPPKYEATPIPPDYDGLSVRHPTE